ncbi:MAG: hypothetical protein R2750_06160 [Bacteroidales bacterium]
MVNFQRTDRDNRGSNSFEAFENSKLSPQGKKLLKEWKKIDNLSFNNEVITYIIRNRNREGLPVEYEIIFRLRSIVGVEEGIIDESGQTKRPPVYGNEHRLSIILPNNYPSAMGGNPEFKMITDTWHPNIRATGKFKGRICLNNKDLGIGVGLDERIIRVGKYLQYQIYWANDSYPWPEDKTVAEWIRDEAEPMGWVNVKEGIYTDNKNLTNRKIAQPGTSESIESKHEKETDTTKLKVLKITKLETEKIEIEKSEKESIDKDIESKSAIELERIEKEQIEAERLEKIRLEAEKIVRERLEAEQKEKERLEAERREQIRREAEMIVRERIEAEQKEKERIEAERKEIERLEAERIEQEKREAERLEKNIENGKKKRDWKPKE